MTVFWKNIMLVLRLRNCTNNWFMNKRFVIYIFSLLFVLLIASSISAADYRYALDLKGEVANLSSSDSTKFPFQPAYGLGFTYAISDHWDLDLSLTFYSMYDDTTGSNFSFDSNSDNAVRKLKSIRLGADIKRYLLTPGSRFNIALGIGGGLHIWKILDPVEDTVWKAEGSRNETTDFASSEVYGSGLLGFEFMLSNRISLNFDTHVDYLTGFGTEFSDEYNNNRDRWLMGSSVSLTFSFGSSEFKRGWPSERVWGDDQPVARKDPILAIDSDGDNIPDSDDECSDTPIGVIVDRKGCPMDSDRDGVSDGLDNCDGTDPRARGLVDIYGCPIDSDFDGIPDFLDNCPYNIYGALVDTGGCPVDTDVDGIPDGLDDCPNTLYGIDVDAHGCVDLVMFEKPMILNINYVPGSFEVDPKNMERIKDLARVLNFIPGIMLEINGYTDNIGQAHANLALSEKRANRVRDYLVTMGVEKSRIKTYGRGEINFVASNDTAQGRTKNRRIEINFFK